MKPICSTNYLKLSTLITLFFLNNALIAQSPLSCDNPSGNYNNPYDGISPCKSSSTSGFVDTFEDRIIANGGLSSAGVKAAGKIRSILVNQSINKIGGFAWLTNSQGNQAYADPDVVGSTFAIDEDGDCVYEREDELLDIILFNQFDEIILYNVPAILEKGSKYLIPHAGSYYDNQIQVNQKAEWHLARFIEKCHSKGLDIHAVVPGNIDYSEFYNFHDEYTKRDDEPFDKWLDTISKEFLSRYQDVWLYSPEDVTYLEYGQDTLFLPLDSDGKISDVDKYIVDLYNFNVFQFRLNNGYITQNNQDIPVDCSFQLSENCNSGFDGHIAEIEWWDYSGVNPDTDFGKLLGVLNASNNYAQSGLVSCYPEIYTFQDRLDRPTTWTGSSYTAQQRANLIDGLVDRVYLYAYQRVPCDCYWGTSNDNTPNSDEKDFFVKVGYFSNNNIPTEIYPVFNGKFYDASTVSGSVPDHYADGSYGCTGFTNNDDCDYCYNRAGDAMRSLPTSASIIKLGYVENIFQEQYNFDPNNYSPNVSTPNSIPGYAWLKSSVLLYGGVINSIDEVGDEDNLITVYPNPSSGEFEIITDVTENNLI